MKKFNYVTYVLAILVVLLPVIFSGCEEKKTYVTVTFNPEGGAIISGEETAIYDGEAEITAPEVSREGYVFVGWDAEYKTPETDITVNAIWDKLHTVTFDILPEGEDDNIVFTLTSSETVVYPEDPVREGYVFDGWDTEVVTVSEDMVITAKWKKLYTVTFILDGGTTDDTELLSQIVVEGGAAVAPDSEKPLMALKGWDKDFSNVTSDLEVKAIWERRVLSSVEIAELISPATVEINTYRRNKLEYNTGTGFFIDNSGTLVTNYHVIEDAYEIEVMLDDNTVCPVVEIVAFDKKLDLAILKIDRKTPNYLEFSEELPKKGETVYTIGSSLGLEGTLASGIVSYVLREIESREQTYIQTSAPISPGNSGGPLVNEKGFVIGVNTLSCVNGQNLNFAIPIERVNELVENKMTVRAWFGRYVEMQWWLFEKTVNEYDPLAGKSAHRLHPGETVKATCAGLTDADFYYDNFEKKYDGSGKEVPVDLYVFFYLDDLKFMNDIFYGFAEVNITTIVDLLGYDEHYYYKYKDGYVVCLAIYDIFNLNIDFSKNRLATYIIGNSSKTISYQLFMMTSSDPDRRSED